MSTTMSMASTSGGSGDDPKGKPSFSDEFLQLLPGSTQNKKIDAIIFKDDFKDIRDAETPGTTGFSLFSYFYNNADKAIPISNPWISGLARLSVPDVFLDVDLFLELANHYDVLTKTIKRNDGTNLLVLNRNSFMQAFGLFSTMSTRIDIKKQQKRYKAGVAHGLMKKHMPRETRDHIFPEPAPYPYYYKDMHFYMKYNAYALCRVLGIDGDAERIDHGILMMVLDLQEIHSSTSYDYIQHIIDEMHQGFVDTQRK